MKAQRFSRSAVFAAAGAVLFAVGFAGLASSASAATGATILSQSTYQDSAGYQHIVGELQNTGTTNIQFTRLDFNFYDASGRLLSTDFTYASVDILAPGQDSPFHEIFQPAPGYDHYSMALTESATSAPPNHNFTTTVTNEFTDSASYQHIVGTIRNDNTASADFVQAIFTFYDGSNTAVNEDFVFANSGGSSTVGPGQSASFEEIISPTPAFTRYVILTQSTTAPATAASPSPSPSQSPSPSPSPSQSPSPSASPSVAPTQSSSPSASPSATQPPADAAPVVSVSPSVISAGQRVTVTYQGTPGSTIKIYSKTQPATDYTQITTVTLDQNGYGTTSHAPTKNTRIEALTAGGAQSGQPLIQVRSVASFSGQRVSGQNYRFTGRVYPARLQRLVSLYRNGRLFGQGRSDAQGIYVIFATVSPGTYNFFVRTGDDTYNLGTTSAARVLSIS